jgi:hypothetical protein
VSGSFEVDADKALDTLAATWEAAGYDEIGHIGGEGWYAYHKDAADTDALEGDTPDELDARIREDWQRRQGEAR